MSDVILRTTNLGKQYKKRWAARDINLEVHRGDVFGFLGPNGAGKTTTVRMLTSLISPTQGTAQVNGYKIGQEDIDIRRSVGLLTETPGMYDNLSAWRNLEIYATLYEVEDSKGQVEKYLRFLDLWDRRDDPAGSFSKGMKQKLAIARALLHEPRTVFLDEPTLGLDPRGQKELLELIQQIARERGTGVVLCSHMLSEIESICDDVVILNLGQIVAKGTVAEVIGRVQHNVVLRGALRVQVPTSYVAKAKQELKAVSNVKKIMPIGEMEGWLRLELVEPVNGHVANAYQANNTILSALIRAKIPILSFEVEGGKLHDVFLHLTEEAIK